MLNFFAAEEYQLCCQKLFEQYSFHIRQFIPDAVIEHIGSSSITGACSKGDLDIYVAVSSSIFEESIQVLCNKLNFIEKLDTLRTDDLCMLASLNGDDVAIQLVILHSPWKLFLDFRDILNGSPQLVQQYNQLKQSCCNLNMQEYRERKSVFIEEVLQKYSTCKL